MPVNCLRADSSSSLVSCPFLRRRLICSARLRIIRNLTIYNTNSGVGGGIRVVAHKNNLLKLFDPFQETKTLVLKWADSTWLSSDFRTSDKHMILVMDICYYGLTTKVNPCILKYLTNMIYYTKSYCFLSIQIEIPIADAYDHFYRFTGGFTEKCIEFIFNLQNSLSSQCYV